MKMVRDDRSEMGELMALDKSALPPDGGERFNRLIFARSPYLLQHAENPVDWYEWGEAAFEKARREHLPIFLSIGYATCHWCHVMAHESFEDGEVATLMNRYFVSIKVDREERPDIDDFFMTVSQVLTGSGGWPLNVFLTPERHPFMAMTYLPKQGREGMSGLMDLLANIAAIWRQRPDMVEKNCRGIMDALKGLGHAERERESVALREIEKAAFTQLESIYDPQWGGFGRAPKFPMATYLGWLIGQGAAGNIGALEMALQTLRRMRGGGIWDQVGGGVHRYAVDREWLVPHFEKMLYDQALTALTALEAFQATADTSYLEMAENIFAYVEREMTSPEGGFCSGLDADTEGEEGRFYVWSREEIEESLGERAPLFRRYYGVTDEGNFEGRTILNVASELDEFCRRKSLDRAETAKLLAAGRALLLERRNRRVRPFRDDKIIAGWNGLMIAALAKGGAVASSGSYVESAEKAASFVLNNLRRREGRLLRSFRGGPSDIPAFLEDYAFLAFGLLELFEATLDNTWLDEALSLADQALEIFRDPSSGRFAKTGRDAEQMPMPASMDQDGVMPSPFTVAAATFIRLGRSTGRTDLVDHARTLLQERLGETQRQPLAHLGTLQVLAVLEEEPFVARFRGNREHAAMGRLLHGLKSRYIPNLVLTFEAHEDAPSVAVCAGGTCHPPVGDAEGLGAILDSILPPPGSVP